MVIAGGSIQRAVNSETSKHEQYWYRHCSDVDAEQLCLVWEVLIHFIAQHSAVLPLSLEDANKILTFHTK